MPAARSAASRWSAKEGGDGYAVYGQPVSLLNNEFQVRLDFDSNWTYFGFDTVPEVTR